MKIALFRFTSNPWDIVIQNAFKEALQDNKYFDQIDERMTMLQKLFFQLFPQILVDEN